MITVTVAPNYQIVIPKAVREALNIRPGQKFQVVPYPNRIALIPLRPLKTARGFLAGLDPALEREADRL